MSTCQAGKCSQSEIDMSSWIFDWEAGEVGEKETMINTRLSYSGMILCKYQFQYYQSLKVIALNWK